MGGAAMSSQLGALRWGANMFVHSAPKGVHALAYAAFNSILSMYYVVRFPFSGSPAVKTSLLIKTPPALQPARRCKLKEIRTAQTMSQGASAEC